LFTVFFHSKIKSTVSLSVL